MQMVSAQGRVDGSVDVLKKVKKKKILLALFSHPPTSGKLGPHGVVPLVEVV